jgi:membrane associated rhomboid family serine protease
MNYDDEDQEYIDSDDENRFISLRDDSTRPKKLELIKPEFKDEQLLEMLQSTDTDTQQDKFIMSQLESDGAVQHKRHRPRPFLNLKLHRRAYFTFTITAIDLIMFIVQLVVNQGVTAGWWLNVSIDSLIQLGAKVTPLVLQGQVWRLFTALFLHSGFVHLLLNMFSQVWLGMQTERFLGWWRLALIYFLSGIGGNMASAVFLPETLQVGASSAIFGLFGIFAVDLAVNWCVHTHRRLKVIQIIASTVLSLLVGIAPHIDNFAHVGGLVFGVLASLVCVPRQWAVAAHWERAARRKTRVRALVGVTVIVVALVLLGVALWSHFTCSWCHAATCLPWFEECKPSDPTSPGNPDDPTCC